MPAPVVLVHESKAERHADAIAGHGYAVKPYTDALLAVDALEHVSQIELLVTSVRFREGRSNGRSLALMVRHKTPNARFLFLCTADDRGSEIILQPQRFARLQTNATERLLL